jgi:hypothetical protein
VLLVKQVANAEFSAALLRLVPQCGRSAAAMAKTMPKSGLDHPPDVDLVRLPGRQVPVGDLGVPIHQLRHSGVRLGLASRRGLLERLAELDLRGTFGLTGLPQADLPTVNGSVPA